MITSVTKHQVTIRNRNGQIQALHYSKDSCIS